MHADDHAPHQQPQPLTPPRPPDPAWPLLLADVAEAPWRHDFFALLRRIEALHPQLPRLGTALRPAQEPVRVGQDPELSFAPAMLSSLSQRAGAAPRIGQRFFGLFGPMGPLPLHLTEMVRERARSHGDPTALAFVDLFQHRAALLLYRAWAQAQPVCHLQRPDDDDHGRWLASLAGLGGPAMARRDQVHDHAKRFHVGTLARGPRSAEGLARIVAQYFALPVRVEPLVGHWLTLDPAERLRLRRPPPRGSASQSGRSAGSGGATAGMAAGIAAGVEGRLGVNAAAGSRVWDRQSRFGLRLGPLSLARYESFLPGQGGWRALRDWLHLYVGLGLSCELRLVLDGREVPPLALGRHRAGLPAGRLGRSSWLGSHRRPPGGGSPANRGDRDDYHQAIDVAAPAGPSGDPQKVMP